MVSSWTYRLSQEKIGKQKDCELVSEWQTSIINHLYWCVSSTNDDKSDLIKAKWLSLDNYIHNVHREHSKDFPKCAHGRLIIKGKDRKRKWFKRCMFVELSCMCAHVFIWKLLFQTRRLVRN